MRRVSIHLDYETLNDLLQEGLTPALAVQRLRSAAYVLGNVGGQRCHGNWARVPPAVRESLQAQGWVCLDPLGTPEGWKAAREELSKDRGLCGRLVALVVSSRKPILQRVHELMDLSAEVVVWGGREVPPLPQGVRVDSLARVLRVGHDHLSVVVDVPGLISSCWSPEGAVNVEDLVERLEQALSPAGPVTRIALADWHTLPVLRDASGEPITHEAEDIFRRAGYQTPSTPPLDGRADLPEEVVRALASMGPSRHLVLVGRTPVALRVLKVLEDRADAISLWSDDCPPFPSWITWRRLSDVLRRPEGLPARVDYQGPGPGLWARLALAVDRAMGSSEGVAQGDLVNSLVSTAAWVRRPQQAVALLRVAVERGVLLASGQGVGEVRYRLNDEEPGISLMRWLLATMVDLMGTDPGDGQGVPQATVVEALVTRAMAEGRSELDREAILAWINFFVDEGILLRFPMPTAEEGRFEPSLAFSPLPHGPAHAPQTEREASPAPKPATKPPVRVPSRLRDQLLMAVDTYALRHGRATMPIGALVKLFQDHGREVVEAAVREAVKYGDLQMAKGSPPAVGVNPNSKVARSVISRKNRAIFLLKQMAPMGQPVGQSRVKATLVEQLGIREDEATDLLNLLVKDKILRREPQIVTSGGPSFTLHIDDAAVQRAHQQGLAWDPARRAFGAKGAQSKAGRRNKGHNP